MQLFSFLSFKCCLSGVNLYHTCVNVSTLQHFKVQELALIMCLSNKQLQP